MKIAIVFTAVLALSLSAPQPRKLFHEHFDDFLNLIIDEAGHDIEHLASHYIEFEEFVATLDYLTTANFKDLVYEMESLPEFKAVVEFLENDNIDILFFIDRFNEILEQTKRLIKSARHEISGRDFNSFIRDAISEFPKQKLSALFDQKKAEDDEFRVAVENLESDEWNQLFDALWANEVFQNEVQTLAENGIEVQVLLIELKAIFGQN